MNQIYIILINSIHDYYVKNSWVKHHNKCESSTHDTRMMATKAANKARNIAIYYKNIIKYNYVFDKKHFNNTLGLYEWTHYTIYNYNYTSRCDIDDLDKNYITNYDKNLYSLSSNLLNKRRKEKFIDNINIENALNGICKSIVIHYC